MIHIAICFENKNDIAYITKEITACFQQRDILFSINSFHSVNELLKFSFSSAKPDLFIYSAENEKIKEAVIYIKHLLNPKLISIVWGNLKSFSKNELTQLYPVYVCAQSERKVFWDCLHKVYDFYINDPLTFTFYSRPQYISTPIRDILYFASEARRIHLISIDGTYTFYYKLNDLEACLQYKQCHFVRIHQSFLVNKDYIHSVTRTHVKLRTGDILGISNYNRYVHILKELNAYEALRAK